MKLRSPGITPHDTEVELSYEGTPVPATAGLSVAAALTHAGLLALRRTGNGDRGVFCGMGVCGECLVTIDGRPGMLACTTSVVAGMRIDRQPAAITPDGTPLAPLPESELTCELLVIGGGPAGLAAAATAAEAGVEVVLMDDRSSLGGQFYKQPAEGFTVDEGRLDAQYRAGRALIDRVRQSDATVLSGTKVWGAAGPTELYAASSSQRFVVHPRTVILATGAYERAVPFPGWTLPGVMTTGAGQSLTRSYQVSPGQRVLVAGNGPLNVQLAAELTKAGVTVVALVELAGITRPRHAVRAARMVSAAPGLMRDGVGYLIALRRAGVPLLTGRTVVRVDGDGRAERATVARLDAAGAILPGSEQTFDVDAVCVGLGFLPSAEIARLLGVVHEVHPTSGGYVAQRSSTGRTADGGVWTVGDAAEINGAKVAEAAGALAAAEVAGEFGKTVAPQLVRDATRAKRRHERFQVALWQAYRGPRLFGQLSTPDTVVCRCESVLRSAIDDTTDDGLQSAGALKRLTRAGMGRCQGRFCGFVVSDLVSERTGSPAGGFAPQLPFRPTPISVAAASQDDGPGLPG